MPEYVLKSTKHQFLTLFISQRTSWVKIGSPLFRFGPWHQFYMTWVSHLRPLCIAVNPPERKLAKWTSVYGSHLPCEMIIQFVWVIIEQRLLLAKLPLLNRNASPEIVLPHCESIFETPCHPRRCQKCKLKSLQSSASLSLIMTFFSSNTITYDVYPTPLSTKKNQETSLTQFSNIQPTLGKAIRKSVFAYPNQN